jgi:hypothetical protein
VPLWLEIGGLEVVLLSLLPRLTGIPRRNQAMGWRIP